MRVCCNVMRTSESGISRPLTAGGVRRSSPVHFSRATMARRDGWRTRRGVTGMTTKAYMIAIGLAGALAVGALGALQAAAQVTGPGAWGGDPRCRPISPYGGWGCPAYSWGSPYGPGYGAAYGPGPGAYGPGGGVAYWGGGPGWTGGGAAAVQGGAVGARHAVRRGGVRHASRARGHVK